jgi:hypothetical protein
VLTSCITLIHLSKIRKDIGTILIAKLQTLKKKSSSWVLVTPAYNPTTWEAEIGRIMVWGQPEQIVCLQDSISKITRVKLPGSMAQAAEYVLQAWSSEFKPQSYKKKKKECSSFSLFFSNSGCNSVSHPALGCHVFINRLHKAGISQRFLWRTG